MAFFELVSAHATPGQSSSAQVGREVAIPVHLQDGDEFKLPLPQLIGCGRQLFTAKFTVQEGAGRPMSKGTRFGLNTDPDGDGFTNELTVADITAISIFQATLPVPGQVIPNDPAVERAVLAGERLFDQIGCNQCHIDALPLTASNNPGLPGQPGWIYFEPNPYNPAAGPNSPNLRLGPANYPHTAPALTVDLTSDELPPPHLKPNSSSFCSSAVATSNARRKPGNGKAGA